MPALASRIGLISVSSTMRVAGEADRLRREGADVVDFSAGEPDFATPDNVKRAAIEAIHQNKTKYTGVAGIQELRQAICERHRSDYGTDYQLAECAVSVGGKHSIFNLTQALLNAGDHVIIPTPYWVTYKDVVNYTGATCDFLPTDESQGFLLTAAMVEAALTPQTKLIFLNSPSNPSGAVMPRDEMEKIFLLARARGIWILTDECYCRFLYSDTPFSLASLPGAKETVIVSGSLSKTYAMTGWRMGFTLAPAPVIGAIVKLQSHSTSNPTTPAQYAALEAVAGPQESIGLMLAEYRQRRDYVIARLTAMPGIRIAEPKGAFYAYPNISAYLGRDGCQTPLQFAEKLLAQEFVATVPSEAFGTSEHVRISYATSMAELERGLDRFARFLAKL
jgi:aspartate aminotransferase